MLIYIFILLVILGIIYYLIKRQPIVMLIPPVRKINKGSIKGKIKLVGWDLLYPYSPGYPDYPYIRYRPLKRGYSYATEK